MTYNPQEYRLVYDFAVQLSRIYAKSFRNKKLLNDAFVMVDEFCSNKSYLDSEKINKAKELIEKLKQL